MGLGWLRGLFLLPASHAATAPTKGLSIVSSSRRPERPDQSPPRAVGMLRSFKPAAMARNDSALKSGSTLVKEHLRMFTSPSCLPLAVFTNQDAKPNACALVAVLTTLTELQHAVLQFVPYHRSRWGCRWNSLNRCRRSRTAILWCNNNPRSVSTLLITTIAVIPIATRPRLTLRS